ncbi:Rhomboid family [Popillia japonica]|uniref:Rhomboid family n=1 Tax=Popillia japonica TaxID=7064 RepID=A0AAW1JXV4_POPJA
MKNLEVDNHDIALKRTSPSQQSQQSQQTSQQQPATQSQTSSGAQQPQPSVSASQSQQPSAPQQAIVKQTPSSNNGSSNEHSEQHLNTSGNESGHDAISSSTTQPPTAPAAKYIPPVQRTISLPAPPTERQHREPRINYSQSERRERPRFARSTSRKEVIKNFIKRETANFFGVDEENESEQQQRWLDRRKRLASRKYGPLKEDYQIQTEESLRRTMSDVGGAPPPQIGGQLQRGRPDVLPGLGDVPDASRERLPGGTVSTAGPTTTTIRRKDSVARMTWDGLAYVVTTLTRHQPRPRSQTEQWSRSYPSDVPSEASDLEDRAFFERPTPPISPTGLQSVDTMDRRLGEMETAQRLESPTTRYPRSAAPGWRRSPHSLITTDQTQPTVGGNRIFASLLDRVLDNSDRRQYGMGWVGRMFGQSRRKSIIQDAKIQEQLDDMEDYRPMFTYWVTTVQILVLVISLICYGFGPFGLDLHARSGQVLVTSLSLQQVDYMEPANFWFGPRAGDLIHLGAKFAPCMRVDSKILQQIEKTRAKERETACCIRNDDSGCVQSSQADCSKTISTWKKWSAGDSGPGGRISGSVCGLDPKFCDAPASVHPYEWPDDITKWPICRKKANNPMLPTKKAGGAKDKIAEHMVCEVIGHPCCIGIHGQCRITTREYCDFVRGTFHEEASLCSQVSCLNDVCGMIPFYLPDTPDQFYRLWTSLFLHVGILQLAMTVFIQYFLMRDLEKLTGSLRIGIIYMGSGVAGNLASAIFVPYRADDKFVIDMPLVFLNLGKFGPRAGDLIHLGAKFAPCMRVDSKILQQIEKTRAKERETACCIRNDDSGCVQSSQADCSLSFSPNQLVRGLRPSKTISTWKKWSAGDSGPGGRISGSVCGLDPKFCDAPASVHPYEWPDDITKWPICRKKANNPMLPTKKAGGAKDKIAEHMVCEVIGHPCCIGIHGQCRITTREYCDFVRGTFHEEASLCSQVSCLNDVCGMIPFYLPDTPDQFYRLWTSLFLHVGILQLAMTVFIQYFLMRDLEKLTGSLRIGIIYMGSGVAGNLASAIFVPYRADVGPAGSQFGLLACLIVEVLNAWPMLKHPNQALCKLLAITFILFLVGLLPWVDNYAHLFGFVFGFLLSYALLPFVSFGPYDRQKKIILIWVCLLSAAFLFICLVLLFYIIPVYDCKVCSYFNCLPLTQEFCASQNINFKREEPVV